MHVVISQFFGWVGFCSTYKHKSVFFITVLIYLSPVPFYNLPFYVLYLSMLTCIHIYISIDTLILYVNRYINKGVLF